MLYRDEVKKEWGAVRKKIGLPSINEFESFLCVDLRLPVVESALLLLKSRVASFEGLIYSTLTKRSYFFDVEESFLTSSEKKVLKKKLKKIACLINNVSSALCGSKNKKLMVLESTYETVKQDLYPFFKDHYKKMSSKWKSKEEKKKPDSSFG